MDRANNAPDEKLHRINRITTLVYEAENEARTYFLSRNKTVFGSYRKTLGQLGENIDSLAENCKNDKIQLHQLNTIRQLLQKKQAIIDELAASKGAKQKDVLYSRALDEIYVQSYENYKQPQVVKENVVVKHDSVYEIPQKRGILQRLKGLFSSDKVSPRKGSQVTVERTVRIDTIPSISSRPDSIIKTLQKALVNMKQREDYYQNESENQENRLLNSDRILLEKIRKIAKLLENEELQGERKSIVQSSEILHRSTSAVELMVGALMVVMILFLFLIFRDIANSRQYQKQLQEAKRQTEELMKIKEQFLANMSHEIRTPLGSIIGFTEQLQKTPLSQQQHQYLDTIDKSSEHLLALVNDILDLSKIEAGKLTLEKVSFNLNDLINQVCQSFSLKFKEKGIEQYCSVATTLDCELIGDPLRIRQVLMNIVGNALKFTEDGSVRIEAFEKSRPGGQIVVGIAVFDTGIGIAKEKQQLIFDEFSQADTGTTRKYGGTGLGLSIARKIIQLHNGQLLLESTPGKGSMFTIEVPFELPGQDKVKSSPAEKLVGKPSVKGAKVLMVDDDESLLMLATSLFKNLEVEGETISDAQKVIWRLQEKHFDVLFTDLQMPGRSGLELLKMIRSHSDSRISKLPVVALSANVSDRESMIRAGFSDCMSKPFKEADFYHKLVEVLHPEYGSVSLVKDSGVGTETTTMPSYSLDEITAFTGDDQDTLRLVIQTFTENSLLTIEEIKRMVGDGNMDGIAAQSHKLLPMFKQFRMVAVVSDFEKLERYKSFSLPEDQLMRIALQASDLAGQILKQIQLENA